MHWIKCTSREGKPVFINLARAVRLSRENDAVVAFTAIYGNEDTQLPVTCVRETPEEIIAAPNVSVGA